MGVDLLVFEAMPQSLDEDVVHAAALPSMLMVISCSFSVPVSGRSSTCVHLLVRILEISSATN
jgi:hypothetical protein